MVYSLAMHKLLKVEKKQTVKVKKIHPPDTEDGYFIQRKEPSYSRYQKKDCNGCHKPIIHSKRSKQLCVDCIIQVLIDNEIIEIEEKEFFKSTS
jgi:hypothetical protein